MQADLQNLPITNIIMAVGGLGTAAFGLLEALKPVCPFINSIGLGGIKRVVASLTPPEAGAQAPLNALPQVKVLQTLGSNWVNGNDLASQKAIAKSLIKLHLSPGNAAAVASAANVDPALLTAVASSMASGVALTQPQGDAYSRFDLIVTAMLDECYQCSDQVYRNWTRALAAIIAVILSLAGGFTLEHETFSAFLLSANGGVAFLVGLLATPLAPIAKDLSTALSTAVNAMQLVKKP